MNDETRPKPGPETAGRHVYTDRIATLADDRRYWRGCPCGCASRPGGTDDPDCIRHQPLPAPVEWPGYDADTLGLVPHDRTRCASCLAVAA